MLRTPAPSGLPPSRCHHPSSRTLPTPTSAALHQSPRTHLPTLKSSTPRTPFHHPLRPYSQALRRPPSHPLPIAPRAAPSTPTTDLEALQKQTARINSCRSLQQLVVFIRTAAPDANTIASVSFRAAALWVQFVGTTRETQDADEPEVQAWQVLQEILPCCLVDALPSLPVDTQIAVAVACAQLDWRTAETSEIFEAVAVSVAANFDRSITGEMHDANLMLMAAAYATSSHYNTQMLEWLGHKLVALLSPTTALSMVANCLQMFLELRYQHPALLEAVRPWILQKIAAAGQAPVDDEVEGLVIIGLLYATFEAGDRELYDALMGAMARCSELKKMNPTIASCVQVLSILAQGTGATLPRAVAEVMLRVQREHSYAVLRYCMPAVMEREMLQRAMEVGVPVEQLQQQQALLGMEVEDTLRLLGLPVVRNQPGADGFIALHMLTEYKGREVVVQLLDPTSFCTKPYWRLKGTVLNELRALERLGLTVVAVPWFEWARLEGDPQRSRYLVESIGRVLGVQQGQGAAR